MGKAGAMNHKVIDIMAAEGILRPDEVAADYFLLRVKNYEREYNLSWGEFLSKYDKGEIDPDKGKRDFVEWAFMCRTFSSELLQAEATGPPRDDPNVFAEKPENLSGFCFGPRTLCSTRKSISSKSKNNSSPVKHVRQSEPMGHTSTPTVTNGMRFSSTSL